jgi:hypothetical protein
MLHAMTLGVKRVDFEQVYASNQAIWIPSSSGKIVAKTPSGYYALITASEFFGCTGGKTKVEDITPASSSDGTFAAYVAYSGNTPNRIALLNLHHWDFSQHSVSRGSPTEQLEGLPTHLSTVKASYLTNPGGAAQNTDHTTFRGSQWTFASAGKEKTGVQSTDAQGKVSGGKAEVVCPDSSVAIVYLD